MYDAIILAGGANNKSLSKVNPQPYEALIEIAGRPMVSFVADALAASSHVNRIFVVGPAKELANCQFPGNTTVLEGGRTILETISIGMEALGHKDKVLIATADIPLLTQAAVDDFLAQCSKVNADLYYPVVAKDINNRQYPDSKRTYVRLKEGTFTGGNIFLVNPQIVPQCMSVAEKIIDNRKNPWKLACIMGWTFLFQFVIGLLSLKGAESRVSEILGITGAVIQSSYPELGIDVDKESDLELVRTTVAAVGPKLRI
ncbi:nucleotidyltransferase family protein [Dendrosporobacter sp. 1207_IL3150]|uniref:nucleotidyltransferase family protein n=1 Tax=Dendrosporobacter sp. 1207_IL3150 TaxID=3084054 RepID=UPI002FDB43D0